MYARLYQPRRSIIIEFGLYHLLMRIAVVCTSRETAKKWSVAPCATESMRIYREAIFILYPLLEFNSRKNFINNYFILNISIFEFVNYNI